MAPLVYENDFPNCEEIDKNRKMIDTYAKPHNKQGTLKHNYKVLTVLLTNNTNNNVIPKKQQIPSIFSIIFTNPYLMICRSPLFDIFYLEILKSNLNKNVESHLIDQFQFTTAFHVISKPCDWPIKIVNCIHIVIGRYIPVSNPQNLPS